VTCCAIGFELVCCDAQAAKKPAKTTVKINAKSRLVFISPPPFLFIIRFFLVTGPFYFSPWVDGLSSFKARVPKISTCLNMENFVFGGRGELFGRGVPQDLTPGGVQGGLDLFLIVVSDNNPCAHEFLLSNSSPVGFFFVSEPFRRDRRG